MRLTIACAATLLLAAPAMAEDLSCDGPVKRDATHATLGDIFGKANVITSKIPGPEGSELVGSVVFPKDKAKKLSVVWDDEKKRARTTLVRPEGPGWTISGLALKARLADVEKANGRPFVISGFGWDYGGYVTDFKGGALATFKAKKCSVSVRFAIPDARAEKAPRAVMGDGVKLMSNDRRLAGLDLFVSDLSIGFPSE